MTKGRKNDFKRIEGGEIVRVRNRNKVQHGRHIRFTTKIGKGRKKAKWNKTREGCIVRFEILINLKII